jgi:hypothetical protein
MGKSTEGVVLKDGHFESLSDALNQFDLASAVNEHEIKARSQFVQNLKKSIGELTDPQMPIGIKPTLQRLIQESDYYIKQGNEHAFLRLCNDAIEVCSQGWSYLSFWISSEQNICYSIYWSLKAAIEDHKKQMLKVNNLQDHSSKNDAVSSLTDNPNATGNQTEQRSTARYSLPLFNTKLMQQVNLMLKYGQEQSKTEVSNVVRVRAEPFASCQEFYKKMP